MVDELAEILMGASPDALAESVSFATPLVLERLEGRDRVAAALAAYADGYDRPAFDLRVQGEQLSGGAFSRTIDGNTAQVLLVAERDDAGLVNRIDGYGRPWPFMALLRERLARSDPSLANAALGADGYVAHGPGSGSIEAPPVPPLADDVAFHSPILTATATGRAINERILAAAAEVYGEASYRAILQVSEQPAIAVLYDGAIDQRTLQVAAVFTLNEREQVADIRIFSRPWPVTAYFRARMFELLADALGPEYWQGPDPRGPLPAG
jgi:hypothetical protein